MAWKFFSKVNFFEPTPYYSRTYKVARGSELRSTPNMSQINLFGLIKLFREKKRIFWTPFFFFFWGGGGGGWNHQIWTTQPWHGMLNNGEKSPKCAKLSGHTIEILKVSYFGISWNNFENFFFQNWIFAPNDQRLEIVFRSFFRS